MEKQVGWRKLKERKKGGETYFLSIFGNESYDIVEQNISKETLDKLLKMPGLKIFPDDLKDLKNISVLYPKGINEHGIYLQKPEKTTPIKLLYPSWDEKVVDTDIWLEMIGISWLDGYMAADAHFYKGKYVRGSVYNEGELRGIDQFKKAITKYFDLDSFIPFTLFFYSPGLPDSYKKSLAELLK